MQTLQDIRTLHGNMLQVARILEQVGATSSRNEKEDVLKENKDNLLLQQVLEYSYSPYKVYGFGKKSLEGIDELGMDMTQSRFSNIFALLDYLITVNVNNQIKDEVLAYLATTPPILRDLYVRIILKDLRVGITETTINKIWKDLVPKFDVMLAHKYEDHSHKIEGQEFIITTKLDGVRAVIMKDHMGNIKTMSRQGKVFENFVEIEEEVKLLPNGYAYDGEFLAVNTEGLNSKELYKATTKITGKKGTDIKKGVEFHCFDMMPLEDFKNGKVDIPCIHRKIELRDVINNTQLKFIKEVPMLYFNNDIRVIKEYLDNAIKQGQEGIMINIAYAPYECKRSADILKVKKMYTMDLKVVGFEEGTGKYENMLGKIDVDYKGYKVGVGSGFTDGERAEIWNKQKEYLGRVVEVSYFEESKNDKGELSLRFPIFKQFRFDKEEVSYE